ncbi:hypothetical protein HDF25_004788 [Pedobacter cryoconitis]|uniref:Uncharacterized protein n=1 Tax=Pedobacter cryoconitis TaxID=188932 RepID=A0A7X0J877_9SPHI|nr:hypothetical protein [Pedobacter cryoconitis]
MWVSEVRIYWCTERDKWINYGIINPQTAQKVTVSEIYNFAKNYLKVDYIFWGRQEPFYTKKVIPFLK